MKHFEQFTTHLIAKWRKEKQAELAAAGLAGLSNREYGDKAEEYVQKRVQKITPKYLAVISAGSQSPADIIAVSRRNGYWHIMLIQVKSSHSSATIYQLTTDDKKKFDVFAKFLKKEFRAFDELKTYHSKAIIISTGFAGVVRSQDKNKRLKHRLVQTEQFKIFKLNTTKLDGDAVQKSISSAHNL